MSMNTQMSEIEKLKEIVQKLRSEDGCPWDKVQTHESLKATCVEEAAEVVCGINILEKTGDAENLKEELGDLLLQVMFHAVIAEEEGLFTFDDVAKVVSEKMIRRHPHVFSGVTFKSDEERHAAWEEIKKAEKEGKEWQEEYLKSAMNEASELIERAKIRKSFVQINDELFEEAARIVIKEDKAVIGKLQREFGIGFNRAARIMDQLADAGVVGPKEGTKPRRILMTMEQFDEYLKALK